MLVPNICSDNLKLNSYKTMETKQLKQNQERGYSNFLDQRIAKILGKYGKQGGGRKPKIFINLTSWDNFDGHPHLAKLGKQEQIE